MSLSGIGKSIWKGVKYDGLSIGAGALIGAGDIVPNLIVETLAKVGVPEVIGALAGGYVTPLLAGVIAVATQQVVSHRDKVFVVATN